MWDVNLPEKQLVFPSLWYLEGPATTPVIVSLAGLLLCVSHRTHYSHISPAKERPICSFYGWIKKTSNDAYLDSMTNQLALRNVPQRIFHTGPEGCMDVTSLKYCLWGWGAGGSWGSTSRGVDR